LRSASSAFDITIRFRYPASALFPEKKTGSCSFYAAAGFHLDTLKSLGFPLQEFFLRKHFDTLVEKHLGKYSVSGSKNTFKRSVVNFPFPAGGASCFQNSLCASILVTDAKTFFRSSQKFFCYVGSIAADDTISQTFTGRTGCGKPAFRLRADGDRFSSLNETADL
jgi:hypothetical protein